MSERSVGQQVEAYCSKCAVVCAHSIGALSATRISRVVCSACQDAHAYRKGPPRASPKSSEARKIAIAQRELSQAANNFNLLMQQFDASHARIYALSGCFDAGDIIDHKSFGLGKVARALGDNKIEVIFKVGVKILVHAGATAD